MISLEMRESVLRGVVRVSCERGRGSGVSIKVIGIVVVQN